jgi:hypothetical protein
MTRVVMVKVMSLVTPHSKLAEDVIDILDALTLKKHIFVEFQWADYWAVFGYSSCRSF